MWYIKWWSPPSSPLVEVRAPHWRFRRSKEVWASLHAPQLSGNFAGCGCHHLHSVDNRYEKKSHIGHQKGVWWTAVHFNFSSLLSPRGPVKTEGEGGSLYCIWAPICTEERKGNIDLKAEGKSTSDGLFSTFSGNVTPSNPTNSGTEGLNMSDNASRRQQRNGPWSCWCAEAYARPPDTMIFVWHYICLLKKGKASHHKRWKESVHF